MKYLNNDFTAFINPGVFFVIYTDFFDIVQININLLWLNMN